MKLRLPILVILLLVIILSVPAGMSSMVEILRLPVIEEEPTPILTPDGALPETILPHETPETEPPETTEPAPEIHTITLSFVGDCMLASARGNTVPKSSIRRPINTPPPTFSRRCIPSFRPMILPSPIARTSLPIAP